MVADNPNLIIPPPRKPEVKPINQNRLNKYPNETEEIYRSRVLGQWAHAEIAETTGKKNIDSYDNKVKRRPEQIRGVPTKGCYYDDLSHHSNEPDLSIEAPANTIRSEGFDPLDTCYPKEIPVPIFGQEGYIEPKSDSIIKRLSAYFVRCYLEFKKNGTSNE